MASNVPATFNEALGQFQGQLQARAAEFVKVLPSHITPEKLQRTIITAVQSDPDLLRADRQSLVLACMKAAQDGLLPDKREAALVVFIENKNIDGEWIKRKLVQYLPMAYGLRKKVLQSGQVTDITARVVYRAEVERGAFLYEEGTEAMLRHKPLLDMTGDETTDDQIIAAYSMATLTDGTKSYEVMRRFEIDKVRESSQTGATKDKKGKPRTPKGPWVDWFPEQAKKTVMRRHTKTLPMSGDVLVDVEARDDAVWASSTQDVLASQQGDAPTRTQVAPTRDQIAAGDGGGEALGYDQTTGEIDDEEIARQLDGEGFQQMDGRTDEQHGDQHDGDDADTEHPSTTLANDFVSRLGRAEIIADVRSVEAEFAGHSEAMREGDVERVKLALDAAALRFKPTKSKGAAKDGEQAS